VNWFRKSPTGKWLWPGFGENSRVLKWIFERVAGTGQAVQTPIGYVPAADAIDTQGLDAGPEDMQELLRVDIAGWKAELPGIREHFAKFGAAMPKGMHDELAALEKRLG
jgi:phosphoenolpyruvate carboxykinase (GTP)